MIFPSRLFRTLLLSRLRGYATMVYLCCLLVLVAAPIAAQTQTKKVRVAVPGYTIAVLSFLAAKVNSRSCCLSKQDNNF